jgi:hypothetical protein
LAWRRSGRHPLASPAVARARQAGYQHHHAFADSIAEIGGGTLHQAIATSIILLLILIPFFAFRSLAEVVGGRVLFRLFFEPRRNLDPAPAKAHSEGA